MAGRGQHDAEFAEFAASSWPRLWRAAFLLTTDRYDAEDLAQTALARTFAAWRRIRSDGAYAYAYARQVLVNANIDRHRRNRVVEVDLAREDRPVDDEAFTAVGDRGQLAQLLDDLTEREHAVVVLRYYFDASEAQVASELGISQGTVKSASSRAMAKLRTSRLAAEERRGPTEGVRR